MSELRPWFFAFIAVALLVSGATRWYAYGLHDAFPVLICAWLTWKLRCLIIALR